MLSNVSVLFLYLLSAFADKNESVTYHGNGSASKGDRKNEMSIFRLPTDTRPVSYTLNIMPDYDYYRDSIEFDGEVEIAITSNIVTSRVTLNCKNLEVYVVYVREKNTDRSINVYEFLYDNANEQLVIKLTSLLEKNNEYMINIEYNGNVKNTMNGIYKSTYNHGNSME